MLQRLDAPQDDKLAQWLSDAPWIDNLDLSISNSRVETLNQNTSFDLLEKLAFWRENGYVVFEQCVNKDLIDNYVNELQHLRENIWDYTVQVEVQGKQTWSKAVTKAEIDGFGVKFNHLHISSAFAARLSLQREVVQFLTAIFESAPAVLQSLSFLKGSQQPIHIDYPYVRQQKRLPFLAASWIPLEDVHPDAGPLAYYPGGHRPEISGFFDWGDGDIVSKPETRTQSGMDFAYYLRDRMNGALIEPVVFCPKKGDVLIWHGNMPHEGTRVVNNSLTRKSYVTHYTGIDDFPDRWLPKRDEWNTRSRVYNGGYIFDFPWSRADGKLPSWKNHDNLD